VFNVDNRITIEFPALPDGIEANPKAVYEAVAPQQTSGDSATFKLEGLQSTVGPLVNADGTPNTGAGKVEVRTNLRIRRILAWPEIDRILINAVGKPLVHIPSTLMITMAYAQTPIYSMQSPPATRLQPAIAEHAALAEVTAYAAKNSLLKDGRVTLDSVLLPLATSCLGESLGQDTRAEGVGDGEGDVAMGGVKTERDLVDLTTPSSYLEGVSKAQSVPLSTLLTALPRALAAPLPFRITTHAELAPPQKMPPVDMSALNAVTALGEPLFKTEQERQMQIARYREMERERDLVNKRRWAQVNRVKTQQMNFRCPSSALLAAVRTTYLAEQSMGGDGQGQTTGAERETPEERALRRQRLVTLQQAAHDRTQTLTRFIEKRARLKAYCDRLSSPQAVADMLKAESQRQTVWMGLDEARAEALHNGHVFSGPQMRHGATLTVQAAETLAREREREREREADEADR
ncbi:hypothetical protein KIPB_009012, partial [Kipferlia bialata]